MWRHAVLQHGGFYSNGNQYSFMQASFYIIVRNGFSGNSSIRGSGDRRMVIAYAYGARYCPGYPGHFAQSDGHVEGSMTLVNTLYKWQMVDRAMAQDYA